jgi:hypothetical protein
MMARLAIILGEGSPTTRQVQLGRILDFFGVPWKAVEISELPRMQEGAQAHVIFGLAQSVAAALKQTRGRNHSVPRQAAFYVYTSDDRGAGERGLRHLSGDADISLREAPAGILSLRVSSQLPDVAGPMSGLEVSSRLRREDAVLNAGVTDGESSFVTVVSAGGAPVFIRFQHDGIPVFFCASSHMIDINQTVGPGFYDVKNDFCSIVPLVMFLRLMFPEAGWRAQELGACLIVDDPLLRQCYGSCDFAKLSDLMRCHEFTTNIAFIPWNWRRTSSTAGEFFRNESRRFSVSIHGCDHIGAEFGTTSLEVLDNKAKLAQSRMRYHEARTGIHHDRVMVFPQGVFSSVCPEVLKRNGFLAAVNTETVPVDSQSACTRIRDVWDVAIMAYGGFPIFTRRYAFHGLENFAFDLLLGKPCLIVSHHDFFKDSGAEVVDLIEKLRSLNCRLRWRPLGEVIRRACRRRVTGPGMEEVEMYGNELVIDNSSNQGIQVRIRKREDQADAIAEIMADGKPIIPTNGTNHVCFEERIERRSEKRFQVIYREQANSGNIGRSLGFELSVAARRILSEFRDDHLSGSSFLNRTSAILKNVLAKVN